MFRVVTLNVNGIRSAVRKGLVPWIESLQPDAIAIQELKAFEHQVPAEFLHLHGFYATYVPAQKPGYSGVALLTRQAPSCIAREIGMPDMDAEGRWVRHDIGELSLISLYAPSGTSGEQRQAVKYSFLDRFLPLLATMRKEPRHFILCGDVNIAHREIDIHDPKRCSKLSGFLPEERRWLDTVIDELGWVDAFRRADTRAGQYTWWSSRANSFEKNLGWRIDYQLISPSLGERVLRADIARNLRFSDHAALVVEYDI